MTRLIDADALHTLFDEKCASECAICTFYENCKENLYCGLIDLAPTVEERPQGEWIKGREISREMIYDKILHIDYENFTCSNCGLILDNLLYHFDGSPFYKYCPNCGADMRGDNNDKV